MARVSAPAILAETKSKAKAVPPADTPKQRPQRGSRRAATASRSKKASAAESAPQDAAQPATPPAPSPRSRASEPPPLPPGDPGAKRITLPMWTSAHKELAQARVEDEIDTTIRIRAMIEIWMHDERFRQRVNKLAKQRASTLHRGRPRTRS